MWRWRKIKVFHLILYQNGIKKKYLYFKTGGNDYNFRNQRISDIFTDFRNDVLVIHFNFFFITEIY